MKKLFFLAFLFVATCSTSFAMDQGGKPYSKHDDPLYKEYCVLLYSVNHEHGKAIKEKISNLSAADKKLFWSYLADSNYFEHPVSIKKYYNALKCNKDRRVHICKTPQTLLHCAVQLKSNDLLLLLLAVEPTILNSHSSPGRNTPLHLACRNLDLAKIKLLVWAGADKYARDHAGTTPVDIITKFYREQKVYYQVAKKIDLEKLYQFLMSYQKM